MRICIYGLPCSGKTTLMNKVNDMEKVSGGELLHAMARSEYKKEFRDLSLSEKDHLRRKAADYLKENDDYLIDGHYAFGLQPVLPDEETLTYDVSIYLYTNPETIKQRMLHSEKNRKYADYNIASWQTLEIEKIREKCHRFNKDFYVVSDGGEQFIPFLKEIRNGFSCYRRGLEISKIVQRQCLEKNVVISDGDKTLSIDDTEYLFSKRRSSVFDGNYYTGYQTWLHSNERETFPFNIENVILRSSILNHLKDNGFIVSSGPSEIWTKIADKYGLTAFTGNDISADTKYFLVKELHAAGKMVTAYGDGMSDYFMLREADLGILLWNGRYSKSLQGRDLTSFYIMDGSIQDD